MVKKEIKKTEDKNIMLKIGAGVIAGVMVGAVGASVMLPSPEPVDVEALKLESFNKGVNSVEPVVEIKYEVEQVEVEKIVEVPVEVEKIVEVEVDSDNLQLVLDEIYDNDGKVEYLTEDLDEDEISEIVERIAFISEAKKMAINYIQDELADELDNVEVTMKDNSTVELDEDDVEKLRLDNDDDEILVNNIDYEDKDVDVTVTGRFRHDDVWFTFESVVEIEDGEVNDFEIVDIQEE